MTTLMQDVNYALRQLRKTPAFTLTVMLTLALGIGANAAIFTLVNSVLLKSLPVVDPTTLVRLGDSNDCCVNGGVRDDGNYSLFSTETYKYLRKNIPEFEELAAMQAGFGYRPVTVRRDGVANQAQSVMGEFVSGNYFRTFGLKPAAGRLFTDSDDTKGAPMTAVISYSTWRNTFNGDPSVVGSTFWVNTQAVTIVGVAPQGFFATASPVLPRLLPPYRHDGVARQLHLCRRAENPLDLHHGPRQTGYSNGPSAAEDQRRDSPDLR